MFFDIEKTGLYRLGVERSQQKIILNLLTKLTPEQVAEFSGVPLSGVKAIAKADKCT